MYVFTVIDSSDYGSQQRFPNENMLWQSKPSSEEENVLGVQSLLLRIIFIVITCHCGRRARVKKKTQQQPPANLLCHLPAT